MQAEYNFNTAPSGATGGNNVYLWMRLPAGKRLRKVAARDTQNGGRLIRLALCANGAINTSGGSVVLGGISADHFPLKCEAQRGIGEWVEWEGDLLIGTQFPFAAAQYNDTTDSTPIRMLIGYE